MSQSLLRKPINRTINGTRHVRRSQRRTQLLLETLEDRLAPAAALSAANQQMLADYGQLPLSFEANAGQTAAQVQYLARGNGYSLFLTPQGATLNLQSSEPQADPSNSPLSTFGQDLDSVQNGPTSGVALAMNLLGANPQAQATGQNQLPGTSNYFIGDSPSLWRTGVASYAQVAYQDVYPGVNMVYHGNQQQLEYDFVLAPGADPSNIRFDIEGADSISLNDQGNLVLDTALGDVVQDAPVVYQTIGGERQQVAGQFVLFGQDEVGFQVGAYDASQPLTIDPTLSYSTCLGGISGNYGSEAIAVDNSGCAYVTGCAAPTNFPTTPGAFQISPNVANTRGEVFVTKLNATGTALVYSTYIGGSILDEGKGIAVDSAGDVYITGTTLSNDFPTTPGAFQTANTAVGNSMVGFVTKLNATGTALLYSTYIGGFGVTEPDRIVVDGAGNAYVVGLTTANTVFPTTPGAFETSHSNNGGYDGFVTKLNAGGTALIYSTYLDGNGPVSGLNWGSAVYGIALDASGDAYVVGMTYSSNFPTTPGAFQTSHAADGGQAEGFVAKLNAAGTALIYSTYLGGDGLDSADGVDVDRAGDAYVEGTTTSTNFPTTPGVLQPHYGGNSDVFVAKLNATGTALIYSTYLGGDYLELDANGLCVDSSGNVYVAGITASPNFPTTPDAYQSQLNSNGSNVIGSDYDLFLAELDPSGSALLYSTFFGGNGQDLTSGMARDNSGNVYITGLTESTNFPTTPSAYQSSSGSSVTSFVVKFSFADPATSFAVSAPASATAGAPFNITVRARDSSGNTATTYSGTVHFTSSDSQAVLPADATLTNGIGTFAVTLKSAGMQNILAADVSNSALSGTLGSIAVSPAPAASIVVSMPGSITVGIALSVSVCALDPYNNVAAGYNGSLAFTSSDTAAVLPANATLTNGLTTFTATFNTAGTQTLSATIPGYNGPITGQATASVATPPGLIVTGLTPTPTGFVVTFNKPFIGNQINLYDSYGTFGPADVTLVGPAPSTAIVQGSLVLGAGYTSFTFVKASTFNGSNFNPASGLLAAGSYTVTLRSASNGFEDLAGDLLEPNAGNTFTTTFIAVAPAVAVGVPSFARGPGNTVSLPNNAAASAAGIPFNLSSGAGVTSGAFTLTYNAALLNITGAVVNPALPGATFVLDASSTPGNAVLDFSSPTPLAAGVIRLGSLQATVPSAAASDYRDMGLLQIAAVQLNGGAIAVTADNAVEVAAYLGDTMGDGQLSAGDASLIMRVASEVDTNLSLGVLGGFAAYPLADPVLLGDLTSSGSVNAADVTLMNSYLAGMPRLQIPTVPTGLTIVTTGPDPSLSLLTNLQATPGSTVIVPLNIDTARPEGSTGMMEAILAVKFDPTEFTVSTQDVDLGTLPMSGSGWQLETAINNHTGEIGIDLFSNTPIQSTSGGSLVTIALQVRQDAPAGSTGLELVNAVNPTGHRNFQTTVSDANGAFTLHPAATALGTEPGSPGQVTVLARGLPGDNDPLTVPNADTVLNPTAGAFAGDASASGFRQAMVAANSPAFANDPRFAFVNEIFGNPDLLHMPESAFGQPEPLFGSEQTDSMPAGPSASDFLLAHTAVIQPDQVLDDGLIFTRQTVWRGRRAPFADLVDDAVSGPDQAELAGVNAFFAREVAAKRGQ